MFLGRVTSMVSWIFQLGPANFGCGGDRPRSLFTGRSEECATTVRRMQTSNPVLCFFHHRKTVWSHLEPTRTSHKIFSPHWSGPLGCIFQRAVKKALPPLYMWLCTVYRIPRRYTALMLFVVEDSRISRASWSRQAVQSFSKAASSRAVV